MAEVTVSEAQGMYKRLYDPEVVDVRPRSAVGQRAIPFNKRKRLGESYQIPVAVKMPNGFTYAGSSGAAATLNAARNMVIKQASATGYELDLREEITWKAISQAVEDGEGAFGSLVQTVQGAMIGSSSNRLEATLLHGQRGYGTIESVADAGSSQVNVVITAATWSNGLWWACGQGSTWDAFTSTTKNNATGVLVLQAITSSTRTLKFDHSGTFSSEVAAGDVLYPQGAYDGTTHTDAPGLLTQCSNTTGTSLGLSATTYINWGANTYTATGPISHGMIEDAVSRLRDRGAEGRLQVWLSNKRYSTVAMEVASLRMVTDASPMQKIGVKGITIQSADVGDIEIINNPMMKDGEFLILPVEECERVGSSDITDKLPGLNKGEFFRYVQDKNTCEFGVYSDQAVICKRPNWSMVGTGLTD